VNVSFQPVLLRIYAHAAEGRLVYGDDELCAIVGLLGSDQEDSGRWFVEAGLGRLAHPLPPTFGDLDEVASWVRSGLAPFSASKGSTGP
jgi:hypothetical protein